MSTAPTHPLVALVCGATPGATPCQPALDWLATLPEATTPEEAWTLCPDATWSLWIAERLGVEPRLLGLAACDIAETALHLVPAGEDAPRVAIETARRYWRGEATLEEVEEAAAAARADWAAAWAAAWAARAAWAAAWAAWAARAAAWAAAASLSHSATLVRAHIPWSTIAERLASLGVTP